MLLGHQPYKDWITHTFGMMFSRPPSAGLFSRWDDEVSWPYRILPSSSPSVEEQMPAEDEEFLEHPSDPVWQNEHLKDIKVFGLQEYLLFSSNIV